MVGFSSYMPIVYIRKERAMTTPPKQRVGRYERLPHRDAVRRLLQAYAILIGEGRLTPTPVSKQEENR